jgi:hypothetical protein
VIMQAESKFKKGSEVCLLHDGTVYGGIVQSVRSRKYQVILLSLVLIQYKLVNRWLYENMVGTSLAALNSMEALWRLN